MVLPCGASATPLRSGISLHPGNVMHQRAAMNHRQRKRQVVGQQVPALAGQFTGPARRAVEGVALVTVIKGEIRGHGVLLRSLRQQAFQWPGRTSRKGVAVLAQDSIAYGQRVRKTQPDGGLTGLGMSPCSSGMLSPLGWVGNRGCGEQAPAYRGAAAARTGLPWARSP